MQPKINRFTFIMNSEFFNRQLYYFNPLVSLNFQAHFLPLFFHLKSKRERLFFFFLVNKFQFWSLGGICWWCWCTGKINVYSYSENFWNHNYYKHDIFLSADNVFIVEWVCVRKSLRWISCKLKPRHGLSLKLIICNERKFCVQNYCAKREMFGVVVNANILHAKLSLKWKFQHRKIGNDQKNRYKSGRQWSGWKWQRCWFTESEKEELEKQ